MRKAPSLMTRSAAGDGTAKVAEMLVRLRAAAEPHRREATVGAIDVEARTVELSFSSEVEYTRWWGVEILGHDAHEVNLARLQNKAALLWMHDWNDQRGVVESVRIDSDRKGRAVVRFAKDEPGEQLFQRIIDKIVTKVSVGYTIDGIKLVEEREGVDVFRVTSWTPYEISMVSVPADDTVGVGRSAENPQEEPKQAGSQTASVRSGTAAENTIPEEVPKMEKILRDANGNLVRAMVDAEGNITNVLEVLEKAGESERAAQQRGLKAEQDRVRSITEMGEKYDARDLATKAVAEGTSADDFQRSLLDHVNTRNAQPQGRNRAPENAARNGSAPLNETRSADLGLTDREVQNYSFFRAIRALQPNASRADREAAAFELECSEAAQRQYGRTAQGILIPNDVLARAFNAGGAPNTPTGAITGQNLVDTTYMAGSFIEMLRNRTTLMRLATVMGGLVGNVEIPKQTGGATAYWIGEGQDATEGTPVIGQLDLSPNTVAAYTDITRRLLMQSTPDAEGIVRRDLAAAIAQAIDKAGYYGTGSGNQPLGIANHSGINAVAFAGVHPTYGELVQMESEIAADNADSNNMAYVMNTTARGAAKTTAKFANGASVAAAGVIWEPGNTVNGYRTEITNQVANGDVFFGNFADVIVGMWGGLDMTVDPYSLSKSGGLRIVVFQDVDVALRRVESMSYGKKPAA